ncbi:MAG: DUF559 domain-containing protein [Gammaproteobacteria bacterium]|nr:DUF559 domain-containing protein [Gammaproteobacteria bacterium]
MKQLARKLRNSPTDAERHIWRYLRKRQLQGYKFRRQEVLGDYIVDFVCLDTKLIIEIDGSQHIEQKNLDNTRTEYLNQLGYKVVRYWNHEVLRQTEEVLADILRHIGSPHPNPPLQGEGMQEDELKN